MLEILNLSTFDKNNYEIKLTSENKILKCSRRNLDGVVKIEGSSDLINELVEVIISMGLNFTICQTTSEIFSKLKKEIVCKLSGVFKVISSIDDVILAEYESGNISTITLAGGCFWCMAKPYYEYDGILKVYSGYSGGKEIMPTYEEVKSQTTSHKECVKIIYDSNIIKLEDILKIYFETIDPFDDGGQFIDRGESYTTAIFYKNKLEKEKIEQFVKDIEEKLNKKVVVQILKESIFYKAEEYHQDYALKNPVEMEEELIVSGRKKVD